MNNYPGKFIVIDGADGSGKATQIELLAENLRHASFQVEIADFPQYGRKSAGLIEEYLNGNYGSAEQVGPYRASIFYACDRYGASFNIKRALKQGKIVISDRYVTANLGHQGAKIDNPLERKHFFDWLYQLEYEIFEIPKPDLTIVLHVPAEIAQKLIRTRQAELGQDMDIHENDLVHLKQAEAVYLEIARTFSDMVLIECVKDGQLLSREVIKNLVWQKIAPILKSFPSESGLDLYSADYYSVLPGRGAMIKTMTKLNIRPRQIGLILDKENLAKSRVHVMARVFASSATSELSVMIINLSQDIFHIAPGQKIAQLLIQKVETPEIVENRIPDDTERKESRFGSSGLF